MTQMHDFDFRMNTGETGETLITTPKINGYLVAIGLNPEVNVDDITPQKFSRLNYQISSYNLKISLVDYPNMSVFDERNIPGTDIFVPVKIDYYNVNTSTYESPDFFPLNDELKILLTGPLNLVVNIKLRYYAK